MSPSDNILNSSLEDEDKIRLTEQTDWFETGPNPFETGPNPFPTCKSKSEYLLDNRSTNEPDAEVMVQVSTNSMRSMDSTSSISDEIFSQPFYKIKISKKYMQEFFEFIFRAFLLAINSSSSYITLFICYFYLGQLEDPVLEASFGLGVSYYGFLCLSFLLGTYEITSILCSKAYGSGKFYKMQEALIKGQILLSIVILVTVISF